MENTLSQMVFEGGSAGVAFIGRAFAPSRPLSQCHVRLSMEGMGMSPPTVDSFHLTAASVVGLHSFGITYFTHFFLVDLSWRHRHALLEDDYSRLPIRKYSSWFC